MVSPSLAQLIAGRGIPEVGHLMLIVVFGREVMLSPTVPVTGEPSPMGMFLFLSGLSILALMGSK